jgi:hypothetical protein
MHLTYHHNPEEHTILSFIYQFKNVTMHNKQWIFKKKCGYKITFSSNMTGPYAYMVPCTTPHNRIFLFQQHNDADNPWVEQDFWFTNI